MFYPDGSVASAPRSVGRWLRELFGSPRFTGLRWPNTTPSSNTKVGSAAFAENPLRRGDHLLLTTLTKMVNGEPYEVCSVSFVTSESSAREALRFLSQQPNTSLNHLRGKRLGE